MKTKKVLETIDVMTEAVVKELNDVSDKIENKANSSDVQTIAKHVQGLESKHTTQMQSVFELINPMCEKLQNLESRVADLDKGKKSECHKPQNYDISVVVFDGLSELTKEQIEYIRNKAKPHTDYFQKAQKLLIEYAEKTMIKKGIEYTPIGDRFANFRPILGEKKTAIEKLIGYNSKHVQYCFMQNENASYPSDTYKRENTAIGYIFGFGKDKIEKIEFSAFDKKYDEWVNLQPKTDGDGDPIEYQTRFEYVMELEECGQFALTHIREPYGRYHIPHFVENKEYYKQCYINELLEHWGDVFNYNVLGLAMESTDRSKAFVVPYADRVEQEKEIKDIVDSTKNFTEYNSKLSKDELYSQLLNHIKESNLNYIIFLFAKQLERLEGK